MSRDGKRAGIATAVVDPGAQILAFGAEMGPGKAGVMGPAVEWSGAPSGMLDRP